MTVKQIRNTLNITNAELADKLGVGIKSAEAYLYGYRSIERAGIAVQRNYKELVKQASEAKK